jgi:hypothetical protein
MIIRPWLSRIIHRFAYWLDRRADDILDIDDIIDKHLK